jgi:4'-phosphopantetheinyl transferase
MLLNLLAITLCIVPSFLHIWQANLATNHPSWAAAEATLSSVEQSRRTRLHTFTQRQTYGRAHGFLRSVLEIYASQPAQLLYLAPDGQGKPQLPDFALHFNLSYRPGRALVAVSDTGPVGADVEKLAPLPRAEPLVSELFSAAEQAALHAAPPAAWESLFYTIWTRKEAYAKALGMGLAMPFSSFSVLKLSADGLLVLTEPTGAHLHSFAAGSGYQGAVATLAHSPAPQHFSYPFDS